MNAAAPCRVVLVGMMGSGKSTIGSLLAEQTGWPYLDNDELVVRATGMSSRDLVEARGEGPMREAERLAAEAALAEEAPVIVAIAGGAISDDGVRAAVAREGFVVWLRAGSGALAARAFGADHRPWLERGGVPWIQATTAERARLYGSVADLTIDTDRLGPADAVARIREALSALASCPPAGDPRSR